MSFRKQVLMLTGVLCSVVFAESAYSVTIYTPQGRPVNAMQLSGTPYFTREWAQYWINWFPLDATIIGDPTRAYNCRGYAWAKTEGIGNYWIQDDEELKFFSDGSYANDGQPSYLSCSQSQATHGCYEPDSDHSVRLIQNGYPVAASGSQTWVSKWNDGPLVHHAPWDDYYAATFRLNYGDNPSTQFVKLKTSHSGTLSSYPKTWVGAGGKTHTLSADVTIPSGVTLAIKSGATANLNSKSIFVSGGTLNKESGAAFSGLRAYLKNGSTIKAYCGLIQAACTNAATNDVVEVQSGTFTENISVSGKSKLTITGKGASQTYISGNISIYNSSDWLNLNNFRCNKISLSACPGV